MIGIVTSAVRDTTTNAMLTTKLSASATSNSAGTILFGPQQRDDRIGQRHRAQREFLALVDIVLDEDAAFGVSGSLQREAGIERDDPRHHHQQRCRRPETR